MGVVQSPSRTGPARRKTDPCERPIFPCEAVRATYTRPSLSRSLCASNWHVLLWKVLRLPPLQHSFESAETMFAPLLLMSQFLQPHRGRPTSPIHIPIS